MPRRARSGNARPVLPIQRTFDRGETVTAVDTVAAATTRNLLRRRESNAYPKTVWH